jgi:hypothetical protein
MLSFDGSLDSESASRAIASLEAIATVGGGVGVFSALDWPRKFANFRFAGTYSQEKPLFWHRMQAGKSPLHLDLDV